MNKLIIPFAVALPLLILTGCTTVDTVAFDTVVYDPGYNCDYVRSVGYYQNRPYWRNDYSISYNYGDGMGYWGGGYYNGY